MKIPMRIKVLLFWHKIFYSKSKETSLVRISSSGRGVKSILFFLPSEKHHAQVVSHFIKRDADKDSMYIKYIVHINSLDHYQEISKSDIITFSDNVMLGFSLLMMALYFCFKLYSISPFFSFSLLRLLKFW